VSPIQRDLSAVSKHIQLNLVANFSPLFQSYAENKVPTSLEAVQAQVLRLSTSDRSRLLDRLIVSLDADAESEAEWDLLANAREMELTSGRATPLPLEDVLARLEERFQA
jgi:Putative addiction module component